MDGLQRLRIGGGHALARAAPLIVAALCAACTAASNEAGVGEGGDGSPEVGPDACGTSSFDASSFEVDAGAPTIGAPCLPVSEKSATFGGYTISEVSALPVPSGAPTCLVYHFQGRVTCPYGQSSGAHSGCAGCVSAEGQSVTAEVTPQCSDRPASKTVVWSCRCANEEGLTSDGNAYCTCPSGTECVQVLPSTGAAEDDFGGAYCLDPSVVVAAGTYPACGGTCDPATTPCP